MAFQSNRNGNWDIFDIPLGCEGSIDSPGQVCELRQLTDDDADDLLPAWSPDGRTIAFVSARDGNSEIYVMDSDGQNQRRVTFGDTGDWRPAWRSDSEHLLFTSDRNGTNDIYQLLVPSFDSGTLGSEPPVVPVVVSPADDRDPAVIASHADKLLFLSDRDGIFRAYYMVLGYQSTTAFAQTQTDLPEAHPAALPVETSWILVSSERDGFSNIYRALLDNYKPLAPAAVFDGQPAAEATAWRPTPDSSLSWLGGLGD